jgi:hypothetical protein
MYHVTNDPMDELLVFARYWHFHKKCTVLHALAFNKEEHDPNDPNGPFQMSQFQCLIRANTSSLLLLIITPRYFAIYLVS